MKLWNNPLIHQVWHCNGFRQIHPCLNSAFESIFSDGKGLSQLNHLCNDRRTRFCWPRPHLATFQMSLRPHIPSPHPGHHQFQKENPGVQKWHMFTLPQNSESFLILEAKVALKRLIPNFATPHSDLAYSSVQYQCAVCDQTRQWPSADPRLGFSHLCNLSHEKVPWDPWHLTLGMLRSLQAIKGALHEVKPGSHPSHPSAPLASGSFSKLAAWSAMEMLN